VAVSRDTALICDTGALLDYLVASAPDHARFRGTIDDATTRYVPGLVLVEVDYFLRDERRAMHALMEDVARGAFTYVPHTGPAPACDADRRALL
jgi:predicted nucleic acid-binding protein